MSEPIEGNLPADKITVGAIYVLTDVERKLLLDLNSRAQQAAVEALVPFNKMSEGVLTLISLQQGLAGKWTLSADKTTLTKEETGVPV